MNKAPTLEDYKQDEEDELGQVLQYALTLNEHTPDEHGEEFDNGVAREKSDLVYMKIMCQYMLC
jgi:NTP pyrophosphatase (non-canonical NTP hydrolase)